MDTSISCLIYNISETVSWAQDDVLFYTHLKVILFNILQEENTENIHI